MTRHIPLFPLDVVLFPGMVLPLHIFESRYRAMINDCVGSGEPFGLIWSDHEPVELDAAHPLIGTLALLNEVVALEDGRFNISTVGGERFRVVGLRHDEPYLVGEIEPYPSLDENSRRAARSAARLVPPLRRYLTLLATLSEQKLDFDAGETDPESLAFVASILYQCQNWRKQELLAIASIPELLERLRELLRLEIPLVERAIQMRDEERLPPLIGASLAVYGLN